MKRHERYLVVAATIAVVGTAAIPAAVATLPVIEACDAHWPAPPDARERAASARLPTHGNASAGHHADASLQIIAGGRQRVVPAGIGVDSLTGWVSPLHTNACDGVIHIEAPGPIDVHLWQLFEEWGVRLTRYCIGEYCDPDGVAIDLNGRPVAMCPGAISLEAGTTIELEV